MEKEEGKAEQYVAWAGTDTQSEGDTEAWRGVWPTSPEAPHSTRSPALPLKEPQLKDGHASSEAATDAWGVLSCSGAARRRPPLGKRSPLCRWTATLLEPTEGQSTVMGHSDQMLLVFLRDLAALLNMWQGDRPGLLRTASFDLCAKQCSPLRRKIRCLASAAARSHLVSSTKSMSMQKPCKEATLHERTRMQDGMVFAAGEAHDVKHSSDFTKELTATTSLSPTTITRSDSNKTKYDSNCRSQSGS